MKHFCLSYQIITMRIFSFLKFNIRIVVIWSILCFSYQITTMRIFSFLKFNIRTSETIFVLRTVVNEFVSLIKFIVMNIRFLVIVVVCVGSTRIACVSQLRESSVSFFVWNCANMKTETTPFWQNWGVHVKTFVLTPCENIRFDTRAWLITRCCSDVKHFSSS